MEEKATNEVVKKSWSQGVRSEFNKIVWPDKEEILRNAIAVVAVTTVLGLIITGFDSIIKMGISFLF